MVGLIIAAALRNKIKRAYVAVAKSLRPKGLRLLPYPLIVVGAIQV